MTDEDAAPGGGAGVTGAEDREGAQEHSLAEALSQAQASAQENWNKYLRAAAELDNVRKRAARDVDQARKFGVERLAGELLAVVDSLEMGLEAGGSASPEALLEGEKATLRLLRATLEKFGVTEIAPAGQSFDPQLHEALSIAPAPDAAAGSVITVVQKGYQLNGRLLRPARVVVAGPAPAETAQASAGEAGVGGDA
jgi:molecular chaperone GrpE